MPDREVAHMGRRRDRGACQGNCRCRQPAARPLSGCCPSVASAREQARVTEVGEVAFKIGFVCQAALRRAGGPVGALLLVVLALSTGPTTCIVRRAARIPETAEGLEGFVNAANALISPALVAMAAVAPLGCLVGAGALMFGSRRGMVIIGASLGTLIFLGSVKGIVA